MRPGAPQAEGEGQGVSAWARGADHSSCVLPRAVHYTADHAPPLQISPPLGLSFKALFPLCTEHGNAHTSPKPSTTANYNCSWTVALSEEDPHQLQSISATTDDHSGVQSTRDISGLPWCKTRSCSAPMGAVLGLPWSQGSWRS